MWTPRCGLRRALVGAGLSLALVLSGIFGPGCVLDWEDADPCGNGVIDPGEECDDGRSGAGDGCSPTCRVDHGWTCIDEPSQCTTTCGDGIIALGVEQCDQEGIPPTGMDGCSSSCQQEANWTCTGEPSTCVPDY